MANYISEEKIIKIRPLLQEGYSTRGIAKKLSIHKNTAMRYRRIIFKEKIIYCPCGKIAGHQGFCTLTYKRSAKRKAFIANWTPVRSSYGYKTSELSFPFHVKGKEKEYPYYYQLILDAVPKNLPEDIRSEVCQDMAVAYLSGYLTGETITAETAKYFIKEAWKQKPSKFTHVSIDQPMKGTDDFFLKDILTYET